MKVSQPRQLTILVAALLVSLFSHPIESLPQQVEGLSIESRDVAIPWKMNALLDSEGKQEAWELIFLSGIITTDRNGWTVASQGGVVERVMTERYASIQNGPKKVLIPIIPKAVTACNQLGAYKIKQGRHDFGRKFKGAVILGNGMVLDIAYQDTRMTVKQTGPRVRLIEMHYGLNVGTNDLKVVFDYLKDCRRDLPDGATVDVTLGYRPEKGVIPLLMEMGSSGYFIPVSDYTVDEKASAASPALASDTPRPSAGDVVQAWDTVAASLREQTLALRDRITRSEEERAKLKSGLAAEKKARVQEAGMLKTENEEFRKQLDTDQKQLDALTKDAGYAVRRMQALEAAGAALRQEVVALRAEIATTKKERDDAFSKCVATVDAKLQSAGQLERALKFNNALAEETAKLRAVLRKFGLKEDVAAYKGNLESRVLSVSADGQVEVAAGSDDGLHEGDRLTAYRNDRYLGALEVRKTGARTATCSLLSHYLKTPIKAGDGVVRFSPKDADPPGPVPQVEGTVMAVAHGLVQISLGARDGLQEGHKLYVFGSADAPGYLGSLQVLKVVADEAVCKVVGEFQKREMRRGDHVATTMPGDNTERR